MAFTRRGNADAFLDKSGYVDLDTLQRAVEDGRLLQRYDFDTAQNRTRYHAPGMVGGPSMAPNTPADPALDQFAVTPLVPTGATSTGQSMKLGAMLFQYLPFRDCFYHRDKQREVAKGLDDLYKELQRVQTAVYAPHPTNPGLAVETKRKLTAAEAGKIIGQRRYHASRATLEQLAVDLGYVGEVEAERAVPVPIGYGIPPLAPAVPGAPTYRTPTPDDIRAAYQQPLSLANATQRIPEGVLAVIRDGALLSGAALGAGTLAGAATAYGFAKGEQVVAGIVGSGISHIARQSAGSYTTSEDGLQNFAQLTGKLGGLAAYSTTASVASATLAIGWVTGTLVGSALTRYAANRKRQNARNSQQQLEVVLQAGGTNPALTAQIQNEVRSAERYEAVSGAFDIASLLGTLGSLGYQLFNGSTGGGNPPGTDEAPKITQKEFNNGSTTTVFDKATTQSVEYTVRAEDDHAIEKITTNLYKVDGGITRNIEVGKDIYATGFFDNMKHALGSATVTDGDTITLGTLQPGEYVLNATATDNATPPQTSAVEPIARFTVTENGRGPVPPLVPSDADNLASWDIRRVYDDDGHLTQKCNPNSYANGAAHENGTISFDSNTHKGTVKFDLRNGDPHTASIDNIAEDTKVFFEGYKDGKLVVAKLADIDASGNYTLNGINVKDFDGYQVWWAEVNGMNTDAKVLCVEALASVNVGNPCNNDYIVEAEESCSGERISSGQLGGSGPIASSRDHQMIITPETDGFRVEDTKGHGMHYDAIIYDAAGNHLTTRVMNDAPGIGSVHNSLPIVEPSTIHIAGYDDRMSNGTGDSILFSTAPHVAPTVIADHPGYGMGTTFREGSTAPLPAEGFVPTISLPTIPETHAPDIDTPSGLELELRDVPATTSIYDAFHTNSVTSEFAATVDTMAQHWFTSLYAPSELDTEIVANNESFFYEYWNIEEILQLLRQLGIIHDQEGKMVA